MNRYIDPILKLLDPRSRDLEPAVGDLAFSGGQVRGVDPNARTLSAVVSTPHVDRYEEIVTPKAFEAWLDVFMSNPVFVAGHTYGGRSGEATVIGHWSEMRITDEGLIGTAKFANTKLAEEYFQLYLDRHMRAFSVGWLTHAWEMREFTLAKGVKKAIRVFTEVELIEVSAVAIPANRESLVRAASAAPAADAELKAFDADALTKSIRAEIHKQLNAEPGGPVANLIQDIVEVCYGRSAHTCHEHNDDDHTAGAPAPPPRGGPQGDSDAVRKQLEELVQLTSG